MTRFASYNPQSLEQTVRLLCEGQANFVQVTTPSTAGEALRVRHGLGRVPRGWAVVKGDPGATLHGATVYDRVLMQGSITGPATGAAYMAMGSVTMTAARGYVATRAGFVTAVGGTLTCSAGAAETAFYEVHKNGSVVFTSSTMDMTATGEKSCYASQAPGVDAFAAGDILQLKLNKSASGSTHANALATAELAFPVSDLGGSVDLSVGTGTTAWTEKDIYVKFAATSRDLTLAIW